MQTITIDPAVASQLGALATEVELKDSTGRVLGFFTPLPLRRLPGEPKLSLEELQRRSSEPGRPLADILRDLEGR